MFLLFEVRHIQGKFPISYIDIILLFEVRHIHSKFCQMHLILFREARAQRCSVEKVFCVLTNLQNSHENTCARASFLIKLQGLSPETLLKKRLWHRCFPVNFAIFLRTPPVAASAYPH